MSASAITDAIIDNLSATSAIGSCQVSTHYAVLEQTSGCCAVVSLAGVTDTPFTFQNQRTRAYTHSIEFYVKDRGGDAFKMERLVQQLVDVSVCSLSVDRTLQGASDIREVSEIRVSHDIGAIAETGGISFYIATGEIDTVEWPDN